MDSFQAYYPNILKSVNKLLHGHPNCGQQYPKALCLGPNAKEKLAEHQRSSLCFLTMKAT